MSETILHITDLMSYKNHIRNERNVVVKFGATWCGPCNKLAPLFKDLAIKYSDTLSFVSIDVDDAEEIAEYLKISALPSIIFYREKRSVKDANIIGYKPELLMNNVINLANELIELNAGYEASSDDSGDNKNLDTECDIECVVVNNTVTNCDCETCMMEAKSL